MDITGTLTGDLIKCTIKSDDKNDGNTMVCDVDVTVDQNQAKEYFEEELERLCFESLHKAVEHNEDGDETTWRFGYQTKKPPKWLVGSVHKANLWGAASVELQPIIRLFTAGDKAPVVTVGLRFEVLVGGDAELIGALGSQTGKSVQVKLAPKNPKLALRARSA